MSPPHASWRIVVGRGLRKKCPNCGQGKLFARWYTLNEKCSRCRFPIDSNETNGNTWAFMYISTAGITGVFIALMLLMGFDRQWMWHWIAMPGAFIALFATLRTRKSVAIALEFIADRCFLHPHEADRVIGAETPYCGNSNDDHFE